MHIPVRKDVALRNPVNLLPRQYRISLVVLRVLCENEPLEHEQLGQIDDDGHIGGLLRLDDPLATYRSWEFTGEIRSAERPADVGESAPAAGTAGVATGEQNEHSPKPLPRHSGGLGVVHDPHGDQDGAFSGT